MMPTHGACARPLFGGVNASAVTSAINSTMTSAQQAAAAAQSMNSLLRATQAVMSMQALQSAARAAAQGAPSSVPDGLGPGGLQLAPGIGINPQLWQNASLPTQSTGNGQTTVTIQQTAPQAILNWSSFNVGRNTELYFNQSAGNSSSGNNWVALNRVTDPSLMPSQILGSIKADGQVYVINQNGIIFGGSSQVNVGSLIASSLNITDSQFLTGAVNQQSFTSGANAATIVAPTFSNSSGTTGDVVVQAGAVIQTAAPTSVTKGGGYVYLFGGNVENNGIIVTPDGQTVLAAAGQPTTVTFPVGSTGVPWTTQSLNNARTAAQTYTLPSDVYLTTSTNPNMRGVTVLMDNGGTATNNGIILAPTGNITMTGLTVQQSGVLAATTSVNEAGSITLFAGMGGVQTYNGIVIGAGIVVQSNSQNSGYVVFANQTGPVTLAGNSVTTVLPQEDGATALDTQTQPQSVVSIEGQSVSLLSGSMIYAPAGHVALEASGRGQSLYAYDNPGSINSGAPPDTSRVWLDSGAVIDVAGLQNVSVPAIDDEIDIASVRANELRDSPLNRGGILESQNVWIDPNNLDVVVPLGSANPQIYTTGGLLEVSGWLGLTERPIDQRLATGGSVTVFSTGDAILRPGSIVNIAGGSLDHQAGLAPTTWLIGADGRIYNINNAPGDMTYVGFAGRFTVDHSHWNISEVYTNALLPSQLHESAYVEGKPAGSLSIAANGLEFDASVYASVVNGPYQRTASTLPASGSLTIGQNGYPSPAAIVIAPTDVAPALSTDASPLSSDWQQATTLSADLLDSADYGSVSMTSGSSIAVTGGATLQVTPGGSISLNAPNTISVGGALVARAGSVTLNTTLIEKAPVTAGTPPTITANDIVMQAGSLIDTRGLWTNDSLASQATTPALYNGGNVTLEANDNIRISSGAVIDASSGGWLQANGKLKTDSNGLPVGTGGNITLISDYSALTYEGSSTIAQTYPSRVYLNGTLRSYGFTAGGQLSITTPIIQIGGTDPNPSNPSPTTPLWLDPSFFASGGFGQYALYSYEGTTITTGTDVELHAVNLLPNAGTLVAPTGSNIAGIASVGIAPAVQQPGPVNLIVSATDAFNGNVVMQSGAVINTDPQATVALHARAQLTIDGTINAPAGTIDLDLTGSVGPSGGPGFDAPYYSPSQTLWIGADARLLAPGVIETVSNGQHNPTAIILGGGSVDINQDNPPAPYYPYAEVQPVTDQPLGAVVAQAGAIIDVSGARGNVLLTGPNGLSRRSTSQAIGTNGGTIAITASQGLFFDAAMKAQGGSATASGGTLVLDQTIGAYAASSSAPSYIQPVFMLIVSQADPMLSSGLQLGQAVPAADQGEMYIGANQIMQGGFASASLGAVDSIVFDGNVSLSLPRSLTINSRNISDGTVTPLVLATGTLYDGTVVAPLAATVSLAAPYVDIGGGQRNISEYISGGGAALPPSATAQAVPGTAVLNIDADLIDVEGMLRSGAGAYDYTYAGSTTTSAVSLAGFQSIAFNSTGDIRLVPGPSTYASGLLATAGNLSFTATEIYPVTTGPVNNTTSTQSNNLFVIQAGGANSTITFASNGQTPYLPLSAGGDLQIIAPTIEQGGVLLAPLGQITFGDPNNPATTIELLPGSITSVSAAGGLIPYGAPVGSDAWAYGAGGAFTLTAPPAKSISLYGQNVTVSGTSGSSAAAVIDESGGGDLYGEQFVSGSGGSVDTLNGTETFAILPSLGSRYAPRDPQMWSSNPTSASAPAVNLQVGDQVYLTGIPGLAAGYYTLLPGHYALLPGGYKLTVAANATTLSGLSNVEMPNGGYRVVGYSSVANTTIQNQLPSIFVVTPGSVVRTQSQYDETTAGLFFASQAAANGTAPPYLPQDAGRLLIDITNVAGTLVFQGLDNFSTQPGGRGGQADIVAPNLDILGPGGVATAGYVGIAASQLDAIDAQSLLIGGTRSLSGNTLTITASAQNVIIDTGAVMTGPEIMLAAQSGITIAPGARIDTTGSATIPNQFPNDPTTGKNLGSITVSSASGSSALVIVSNAIALPVTQTAGTSTLTISAGADLFAADTLFLGSNAISFDPSARLGASTVTVQLPLINIGTGGTVGLTLTNSLLAQLSQGDPADNVPPTTDLVLAATQGINVYGSTNVGEIAPTTGQPVLATLTLSAPAINGFGGASDSVTLTAGNVTLLGTCAAASCSGIGSGQGAFTIDATQVTLGGGGALPFSGFNTVTLAATEQVIGGVNFLSTASSQTIGGATYATGQVVPGTFSVTGNLVIAAPLVTAGAGAITNLVANNGTITFAPSPASTAPATAVASDGATLTVSAQTITQDTKIVLPSGAVTFTAQNGVTLGAGSDTSVAGAVTPFFDVVRISPAGSITLQTVNGNVVVANGATVDVSGGSLASVSLSYVDVADSDQGGNAGTFTIIAPNGTAQLGGALLSGTVAGYTGGKAILNLGSGDTPTLLGNIAGFSAEQSIALATGDIIAGNITAQDVELSASTGTLTVTGTINAAAANGGTIRLTAGYLNGDKPVLELTGSALLETGTGGSVFLGIDGSGTIFQSTDGGRIKLDSGATISAPGGQVWLRAPRIGNTGVAIVNNGATITGTNQFTVEAVQVYNLGTDSSGNAYVDQWLTTSSVAVTDATTYMANATAISANLNGLSGVNGYQLLPGIEFRSSGSLVLLTNPSNSVGNPLLNVDGNSSSQAASSYIYYDGIDLSALRFNGAPAVLTLRAAGNLTINGSLSDGFSAPVISPDGPIFAIAPLAGGSSSTLRLVAGANPNGADPLALTPTFNVSATGGIDPPGSIIFAEPYLNDQNGFPIAGVVRTGTGDLALAAGGNIDIQTPFGIYTAGRPSTNPADFSSPTRSYITSQNVPYAPPNYLGYSSSGQSYDCDTYPACGAMTYPTALYPSYPVGGGNLTVAARGDLTGGFVSTGLYGAVGAPAYAATEPVSYWLWTEPLASSPTWFINFGTYYQAGDTYVLPSVAAFQGLGALGGGNVSINVSGSMNNVDVVLPTTGRLGSTSGLTITGGGNLTMNVAGAISNANIYDGKGTATIQAGDIGPGLDPNGNPMRVDLMIGDAQFTVDSMRSIVALIGDATRAAVQPDPLNYSGPFGRVDAPPPGLEGFSIFNSSYSAEGAPAPYGFFTTMTANSAIATFAEGGNISLMGDYAPPVMEIVAASGSISMNPRGVAFGITSAYFVSAVPAQTARVDILAEQNVTSLGVSMTAADLTCEHLACNYAGSLTDPNGPSGTDNVGTLTNPLDGGGAALSGSTYKFGGVPSNLVQFNDPFTVHVYAVQGSLTDVSLATSERASIRAGLDIVKPLFNIENTAPADVSLIQAGRDITSCLPCNSQTEDLFNIRSEGPGTLVVLAGRNIFVQQGLFGSQGMGIESVGNADNPINLPQGGAVLDIAVGVGTKGPDITDFINTYLDPANAGSVTQNYLPQLVTYMDQLEGATISPEKALALFRALSPAQQMPLIDQIYYAEVDAGGQIAATGQGAGGAGYDRSYKAIETLFPGSVIGGTTMAYNGSLTLYQLARIRTDQGGAIGIMAPGGGITLGLVDQTPNLVGQTDTARPGLLTLEGGDVDIVADQSIVVAQSRIFTELGGNIEIWSTNGDINAGKGKQTSIVTTPPSIVYNAYGDVTKTPATPQTGAGIATLIGVPGVPPGNVDLFAPHGTVDAGEGGIRVSGNITIAALQVLNLANIQVQGTAVGLPTVQGPPVAALTTASNQTAVTQQATAPTQDNSDRPSVILVEFLGFGGGDNTDTQDQHQDEKQHKSENAPNYDPNSSFKLLGNGALTQDQQENLTDEERSKLRQLERNNAL